MIKNKNEESVSYLSDDIFLSIIKKIENEIQDYKLRPINRIYAYLCLKNLYKSNRHYQHLFKQINTKLVLSGCNLLDVELSNKDLRGIRLSHSSMKGIN